MNFKNVTENFGKFEDKLKESSSKFFSSSSSKESVTGKKPTSKIMLILLGSW